MPKSYNKSILIKILVRLHNSTTNQIHAFICENVQNLSVSRSHFKFHANFSACIPYPFGVVFGLFASTKRTTYLNNSIQSASAGLMGGTSATTTETGFTMVNKVTFFIGLNDKDSKTQKVNTLDASNIVANIFVSHDVDGATINGGQGIYKHEDGSVVIEQTIIVQVFEFGEPMDVRAICADVKAALNQESIAVERSTTDSNLY